MSGCVVTAATPAAPPAQQTLQQQAAQLVTVIKTGSELEAARAAASLGLLYQDVRSLYTALDFAHSVHTPLT